MSKLDVTRFIFATINTNFWGEKKVSSYLWFSCTGYWKLWWIYLILLWNFFLSGEINKCIVLFYWNFDKREKLFNELLKEEYEFIFTLAKS